MPLISVIIPTNRIGGLDVTMSALRRQTFRDFEIVLVDHLYPHRDLTVHSRSKDYDFTIKHVRPWSDTFPSQAFQRACNTGLMHASGKICLFTCDYAALAPDVLQRHADFHASRKQAALIGIFRTHATPALRPHWPDGRYGAGSLDAHRILWAQPEHERAKMCRQWASNYLVDLADGNLRHFMWSIFEPGFNPHDLPVTHLEPKASMPPGQTTPFICHLKNDSFLTESLIEINGFDLDYDGGHGYQDTEIATRLHLAGTTFHLDPRCVASIIDIHHLITIRYTYRPESLNHALFARKMSGPTPPLYANPMMNLRSLRESRS